MLIYLLEIFIQKDTILPLTALEYQLGSPAPEYRFGSRWLWFQATSDRAGIPAWFTRPGIPVCVEVVVVPDHL